MRRVAIDTNIYVAFKKNELEIVNILSTCDLIKVDVTVLAELFAGFKLGKREKKNQEELVEFLNSPRVEIMNHDSETSEVYAKIVGDLKEKGRPIPTNDIWIAATAMQHGLWLLTLDAHFKYIEGLLLKLEK